MMGFNFKIEEIENGWVVEFFTESGPTEKDQTLFYPSFPEVIKAVEAYRAELEASEDA